MQPLSKFRPATTLPKPPAHLAPATKLWWSEIVALYELESHHLRLLTLAAESWDRVTQARQIIAKEGMTFKSKDGTPRRHPAVQIEHDSKISFARLIRELALDVTAPPDVSRPPAIGRR